MRTYEEILNDVIDHHFKNVSHKPVDLRKEVAKEYAKQWIDQAAKIGKEYPYGESITESILDIKNQIDKQ